MSSEPAEAFHARVAFCLDLHNEAVKAMRYEVSPAVCCVEEVMFKVVRSCLFMSTSTISLVLTKVLHKVFSSPAWFSFPYFPA